MEKTSSLPQDLDKFIIYQVQDIRVVVPVLRGHLGDKKKQWPLRQVTS
jgi:hypothetical protein